MMPPNREVMHFISAYIRIASVYETSPIAAAACLQMSICDSWKYKHTDTARFLGNEGYVQFVAVIHAIAK